MFQLFDFILGVAINVNAGSAREGLVLGKKIFEARKRPVLGKTTLDTRRRLVPGQTMFDPRMRLVAGKNVGAVSLFAAAAAEC